LGVISPKNKEFYPQDTLKTLFLYNYPYDCKSDWVFRGCLQFIDLLNQRSQPPSFHVIASQSSDWRGTEGNACGAISFDFREESARLMGIPTSVCALARNDSLLITAR